MIIINHWKFEKAYYNKCAWITTKLKIGYLPFPGTAYISKSSSITVGASGAGWGSAGKARWWHNSLTGSACGDIGGDVPAAIGLAITNGRLCEPTGFGNTGGGSCFENPPELVNLWVGSWTLLIGKSLENGREFWACGELSEDVLCAVIWKEVIGGVLLAWGCGDVSGDVLTIEERGDVIGDGDVMNAEGFLWTTE